MILYSFSFASGECLTRFDPRFTATEPFYIDENLVVSVDMMLGPKYPLSVFTHNELDAQVHFMFFSNFCSPFGYNMCYILIDKHFDGKMRVTRNT